MLDTKKLQEIKKTLPHGALKKIQKKSRVSYTTVMKFFAGKSMNSAVAKALLKEVKTHTTLIDLVKNCLSK